MQEHVCWQDAAAASCTILTNLHTGINESTEGLSAIGNRVGTGTFPAQTGTRSRIRRPIRLIVMTDWSSDKCMGRSGTKGKESSNTYENGWHRQLLGSYLEIIRRPLSIILNQLTCQTLKTCSLRSSHIKGSCACARPGLTNKLKGFFIV